MDSAVHVMQYAVGLILLILSTRVTYGWLRSRNRARGYLALGVGMLAGATVISLLARSTDTGQTVLSDLAVVGFLSSGYALVLFRSTILPMSRAAHRLVLATVIGTGLLTVVVGLPAGEHPSYNARELAAVVLLTLVWCGCVGEPAVRLWLAARPLPSVQRAQVRTLSYGYLAACLVLILSLGGGGGRATPAGWPGVAIEALRLAVCMPLLWAGFTPPGGIRRVWRRNEEDTLGAAIEELLLYSPDRVALAARALDWAVRLVGAQQGLIADSDGTLLATHGLEDGDAAELVHRFQGGDEKPLVVGLIQTEPANDSAVVVPIRFTQGQGVLITVGGRFSPVFGAEEARRLGGYCAAIGVALDRALLTEQLHASEERFRSAFDDAPIGIAMVAVDGRILRVNRALCMITGYSENMLLEKDLREITHPDDVDETVLNRQRMIAGEIDDYPLEVRYIRADGSPVWVLLAASLVHDAHGEPLHVVAQVEDISARRQAQEAAEEARLEAARASTAKSEFLSRMSHELRTPLSAVLGFAELLELDGQLNATQAEYVTTILRAGHNLLELINDVLDIARIEEGHLVLAAEPIPLAALLTATIELVRPMGGSRAVSLPLDVRGAGRLQVIGDHQRCEQVLLNLLSNAVKYNRAGGSVTVSVHPAEGRTRIEISDQGAGISAEDLPRLFSPFERLDAGRTEVEGTGLGLALSLRLAEGMGGSVGVRSSVGTGSTFWLELPSGPDLAPEPRPEVSEGPLRRERRRYGARRRVVYVEDTLSNLRLMKGILASRPDVELIPAMRGRLGVELARLHRPDLLLLDLQLPDIAGDEVLRILRADPATRTIPVIVISADATARQVDRLTRAGACDYLTKPLNVRLALTAIDRVLAPSRVSPAETPAALPDPAPA